jgi:hypothetical protein
MNFGVRVARPAAHTVRGIFFVGIFASALYAICSLIDKNRFPEKESSHEGLSLKTMNPLPVESKPEPVLPKVSPTPVARPAMNAATSAPVVEGKKIDRQREQDRKRNLVTGKTKRGAPKKDISRNDEKRVKKIARVYKIYDGEAYDVMLAEQSTTDWSDVSYTPKTLFGRDMSADDYVKIPNRGWIKLADTRHGENHKFVDLTEDRDKIKRPVIFVKEGDVQRIDMSKESTKVKKQPCPPKKCACGKCGKNFPSNKQFRAHFCVGTGSPNPGLPVRMPSKTHNNTLRVKSNPKNAQLIEKGKTVQITPSSEAAPSSEVATELPKKECASVNIPHPKVNVGQIYLERKDTFPLHKFFVFKMESKICVLLYKHCFSENKLTFTVDEEKHSFSTPYDVVFKMGDHIAYRIPAKQNHNLFISYGDVMILDASKFMHCGRAVKMTNAAATIPVGSPVFFHTGEHTVSGHTVTQEALRLDCGVHLPYIKYNVSTTYGDCGSPWFVQIGNQWQIAGFHLYSWKENGGRGVNGGIHYVSLNSLWASPTGDGVAQ